MKQLKQKVIKSIVPALVVLAGIASISRTSQAALLLDGLGVPNRMDSQALCIYSIFPLFIPFCFLDEQGAAFQEFTSEDLKINGYSEEEIALITKDQAEIRARLQENKQKLGISKEDNNASLSADLRRIYPEGSDLYLEFIFTQLGMK